MFFGESKKLATTHPELRDVFRGLDGLLKDAGKDAVLQAAHCATRLGHNLGRVESALDLLADAGVLLVDEMCVCECGTLNKVSRDGEPFDLVCSLCGASLIDADQPIRRAYRPSPKAVRRLQASQTHPRGRAPAAGSKSESVQTVDALIVTAVAPEYAAVLAVDAGAAPGTIWARRTGPAGLEVAFRDFTTADGAGVLRVAVTQALGMGGVNALLASSELIKTFSVRCLAMCGVCAGLRGEIELGDVIIADRLWQHDTGKHRVEIDAQGRRKVHDEADVDMYKIRPDEWIHAGERFKNDAAAVAWMASRPLSYEAQGNWILERRLRNADPASDPEQPSRCPSYDRAIARLWKKELLVDGTHELTEAGRAHISRVLTQHLGKLPEPKPFEVHVGPIASGNKVMQDDEIFPLLKDHVRKVVGVEMEAASVSALAHHAKLEYSVVMKAVMDHADDDKSDNFKEFAARASAECLIAFLRKNLPPRPPPIISNPAGASFFHAPAGLPASRLRHDQKRKLVDLLLLVPVASTFHGRTALLGESAGLDLRRDEHSARLDLEGMVDGLGALASGLLASLVDNALAYIRETPAANELGDLLAVIRSTDQGAPPSPPARKARRSRERRGTDALASYRTQIAEWANLLPAIWRVEGGPEILSEIYVELDVSPESSALRSRLGSGPCRLRELLDDEHLRWVVLGDAGTGKTSLVHALALELLRSGPRLPVLLKVSELCSPEVELAGAVARAYKLGAAAQLVITAAISDGRAVILLDGLDEVTDSGAAQRAILNVVGGAARCQIVVTSRRIGYQRPAAGFCELALLPPDARAQRAILTTWIGDAAKADRTLHQLQARSRWEQFAQSPLLLTLVGLVMRSLDDLPRRRADLYDRAVDLLLNQEHLPRRSERHIDAPGTAKRILAHLSLALQRERASAHRVDHLLDLLEVRHDLATAIARTYGDAEQFLWTVARTTGLLVCDTSILASRSYTFTHRTFREFLAAWALSRALSSWTVSDPVPPELAAVLASAASDPANWAEVLALTSGLVDGDRATALLQRVIATGSTDLVGRVVADAEGVTAETAWAAFGMTTDRDAWPARRKIIQNLPRLVGHLDVAVQILSRLASTTTNGNDLWHLRTELIFIAKGKIDLPVTEGSLEEARGKAQSAANNFFGHIDPARRQQAKDAIRSLLTLVRSCPSEDLPSFYAMSQPITHAVYELLDPGHAAKRNASATAPVTHVTMWEADNFADWIGGILPSEPAWIHSMYEMHKAGTVTPPSRNHTEWTSSEGTRTRRGRGPFGGGGYYEDTDGFVTCGMSPDGLKPGFTRRNRQPEEAREDIGFRVIFA